MQVVTVHRGGKTFEEHRKKGKEKDSAAKQAPAKLDEEDSTAVTDGLDPEAYDSLPDGAGPAPGVLDKARSLALTVAAKALTWLHQFNESQAGQLLVKGLDGFFDNAEDMKKLGYNPNNTSGTANPKTSDAVSHAIEDHLGFGISGHLVAKIAANVLSRVYVWAKKRATGRTATEDTERSGLELWADLIAQLFAHLAEQMGTDGAPDAKQVLANLEGLLK